MTIVTTLRLSRSFLFGFQGIDKFLLDYLGFFVSATVQFQSLQ